VRDPVAVAFAVAVGRAIGVRRPSWKETFRWTYASVASTMWESRFRFPESNDVTGAETDAAVTDPPGPTVRAPATARLVPVQSWAGWLMA
jgi:hypothetical protein